LLEKKNSPICSFHTRDGGLEWEVQAELETSIIQIHINAQEGWPASDGNFILHTTDGSG
jgi:hypothetical protein